MGKKGKLRKQMRKRALENETALVICTGKKCCPREESRALVEETLPYADQHHVKLVTVGCLHVCKKGPIAASYPKIRVKKHVTAKRARKMLDKMEPR